MKSKHLITTLIAFTTAVTTVIAADEAQKEKKDGAKAKFTTLFDGKSLDGWHPSTIGEATYEVEDGTIVGTTKEGSPNSFLLSNSQYGDFVLEFDVKVDDGLNSGVQIRSREKTAEDVAAEAEAAGKKPNKNAAVGRLFGPQIEIEKSPGQAGYIYGEATGFGWLSPEPADKEHAHEHIKNGEWNHYKVKAQGPRIQTWINGEKVADLTHEEIYKSHPKGHIGLQVHGIKKDTGPYQVSWKNISIRELN